MFPFNYQTSPYRFTNIKIITKYNKNEDTRKFIEIKNINPFMIIDKINK